MIRAITDEKNWIRCGECRHKLGRVSGAGSCDPSPIIEIKCHSCKNINVWSYSKFNVLQEDSQNDK